MSHKHTIESTRELFESRGWKLISEKYISNEERLNATCAAGHAFSISRSNARAGRGCPHCSGKAELTEEMVRSIVEPRGWTMVSRSPEDRSPRQTDYAFSCAKGHLFTRRAARVKTHDQCLQCVRDERIAQRAQERIAQRGQGRKSPPSVPRREQTAARVKEHQALVAATGRKTRGKAAA